MERATKIFVVGWVAAALALEVTLVGRSWPALVPLSGALFVISAAAAWIDHRALAVVLAGAYLFPVVIRLTHGLYHPYFAVLWMTPLFGAMAPLLVTTPWRMPARWRGPLVLCALVLTVSGSLVVWREIDFYPALLGELGSFRVPSSVSGGSPAFTTIWVLRVALVLLLGILWFEWLWAAAGLNFRSHVVTPLAASALVMAGVAIYQLFVDVTFLNESVYGNIGRAGGTFFDANVSGTIAAMWIGGVAIWSRGFVRASNLVAAAGILALWLAVWATGSRTAFLGAVIVTGGVLTAIYQIRLTRGRTSRAALPAVLASAAGILLLLAVLASSNVAPVGPLGRVWDTLPGLSVESVRAFAAEMWNRNRYGEVSSIMIGESPWFGVGLGTFHVLVSDFAQLAWPGFALPPDNAQNWYRHQLAELGVVGSLGGIWWTTAFGWFVVQRRTRADPSVRIAAGVLVAFAVISLLGMPGQEIAVAITFWTVAFWFASLVDGSPDGVATVPPREHHQQLSRPTLAAMLLIVIMHGAGTAYLAETWLRVPFRAQRLGWPFSYGFYAPEPDGAGGELRWARQRGVIVVDAPARWMALRVAVNHLDLETDPVLVKVWRDRDLVIDTTLTGTSPVIEYVEVPEDEQRVVIETRVSRVVRPRELGVADDRELGLIVGWRFVDRPPDR